MSSKLIIESGSTKTSWSKLEKDQVDTFYSPGINPTIMNIPEISTVIENANGHFGQDSFESIYYYGAGVESEMSESKIRQVITQQFSYKNLYVYSDMLAACHALCGDDEGIVCILGTGSNSTYYDGENLHSINPSLGYILGDEGSGNQIGKSVLKYYFYNIMDEDLRYRFENEFQISKAIVFENVYQKPMANQYMAQFARFAIDNQDHFMMKNIVEDEFLNFINFHLYKYPTIWTSQVHFVGSIAKYGESILEEIFACNNLHLGTVCKDPLDRLLTYYQTKF